MTSQKKTSGAQEVSLDEIAEMARTVLPPLPDIKEGGEKLGRFAPVWRWLAAAQFQKTPAIRHPRVALYMAQHGAFPEKQTALPATVQSLHAGEHQLCALAQVSNADLQVYELQLDAPARDYRKAAALLPHEAAHAASYGLMAVQPGIDLLVVSCLNPVADLAGEHIIKKISEGAPPFDALTAAGGLDIASMMGTLIAARLAHIPVLLDGKGAESAAAILQALEPGAALHTKPAVEILEDKMPNQPGMAGALLIAFLKSLAKAG